MATDDDDFRLPRREELSPEEEAFLQEAEKIGRKMAAMSEEETAAYIEEHGLQELVRPERVEEILKQAWLAHEANQKK